MAPFEWFTKLWHGFKTLDPGIGVLVCVAGAAIFPFFGGVYAYRGGVEQGRKDDILSRKVDRGNEIGENSNSMLEDLRKRNKELESEVKLLREDNRTLRKANIAINDNITGGKSNCYLEFIPNDLDGQAYVFLRQDGEYPLREIEIYIYDTNTKTKYSRRYAILKVSQHRKFVMKVPFHKGTNNLFAIFISSFNDKWNQQVVIHPATSSARGLLYESAYRVYRLQEQLKAGKLEYEYSLIKEGRMPGRNGMGDVGMGDWSDFSKHLLETDLIYDWEVK